MNKPSNFAIFLYIAKILFGAYFIWMGAYALATQPFAWSAPLTILLGMGFLVVAWLDPDRRAANRILFMTPKKREELEEQERRAAQSAKDKAAHQEKDNTTAE